MHCIDQLQTDTTNWFCQFLEMVLVLGYRILPNICWVVSSSWQYFLPVVFITYSHIQLTEFQVTNVCHRLLSGRRSDNRWREVTFANQPERATILIVVGATAYVTV